MGWDRDEAALGRGLCGGGGDRGLSGLCAGEARQKCRAQGQDGECAHHRLVTQFLEEVRGRFGRLAARVFLDELAEFLLGAFAVAHTVFDDAPLEKHFVKPRGVRVILEDTLEGFHRGRIVADGHIVVDEALEGFARVGARRIAVGTFAEGPHGAGVVGLMAVGLALAGLLFEGEADAILGFRLERRIRKIDDRVQDRAGGTNRVARLFLEAGVRNLHEGAVREEGIREAADEGVASRDGPAEVVLDEEEVPAGFVGFFEDGALESIMVRKFEDVRDAAQAFIRFHASVFLQADILEDGAPLIEELSFENELLGLDRGLGRVSDDGLRFGRATDEDEDVRQASGRGSAIEVLFVEVFGLDAFIHANRDFAFGKFCRGGIRVRGKKARDDAADEDAGARTRFGQGHFLFGAGEPRGVRRGRRGDSFARRRLGALAILSLEDDFGRVGLVGLIEVKVAQLEESGLVDKDAADALTLGTIFEGKDRGRNDVGVRDELAIDFARFGVGVDVGRFNRFGAVDGQDAIARLGICRGRFDGGEEVTIAATIRNELGFFAVARFARKFDVSFIAEGREDGEVLIMDIDVNALARFGADDGVGKEFRFRDSGADHLIGFGGTGPTACFEVNLADEEVGVIREGARGVALNEAAQGHDGFGWRAFGDLHAAEEEERFSLDVWAFRIEGLAEFCRGAIEVALVGEIAAKFHGGIEAGLGIGVHTNDGFEHANRAFVFFRFEEGESVLDHTLGTGFDLLRVATIGRGTFCGWLGVRGGD